MFTYIPPMSVRHQTVTRKDTLHWRCKWGIWLLLDMMAFHWRCKWGIWLLLDRMVIHLHWEVLHLASA
jgi:hypothetical protein